MILNMSRENLKLMNCQKRKETFFLKKKTKMKNKTIKLTQCNFFNYFFYFIFFVA